MVTCYGVQEQHTAQLNAMKMDVVSLLQKHCLEYCLCLDTVYAKLPQHTWMLPQGQGTPP